MTLHPLDPETSAANDDSGDTTIDNGEDNLRLHGLDLRQPDEEPA